MEITKNIAIEDLIEIVPESVDYLRKKGIQCIRCGEPIWGNFEETAKEKGFSAEQIEIFLAELNTMASER